MKYNAVAVKMFLSYRDIAKIAPNVIMKLKEGMLLPTFHALFVLF